MFCCMPWEIFINGCSSIIIIPACKQKNGRITTIHDRQVFLNNVQVQITACSITIQLKSKQGQASEDQKKNVTRPNIQR